MALYTVSSGATILAADINQFYNHLTGATTGQRTDLNYAQTSPSSLNMTIRLVRTTASTNVEGLSLAGGVGAEAVMYRRANDDRLWFGFDTGSGLAGISDVLALGMGTASSGGSQAYHAVNVDPDGQNVGTNDWWLLFGGSGSGEGIGSKRSSGGNQNGLDFLTGSAVHMAVDNTGINYHGGSKASAALAIRPDSTNSNPGSGGAWTRTDGAGGLVLNPSGSGNLYFNWDVIGSTFFGGAMTVNGLLTAAAGLTINDPDGIAFAGGSQFVIERGQFTVSYSNNGNPSTFDNLALQRNYHGRAIYIVASPVAGSPNPTAVQASQGTSANTAKLQVTSGSNTSLTFNYIAAG